MEKLMSNDSTNQTVQITPSCLLPLEIWIAIAGFITTPLDLVNLMLCHSQLYYSLNDHLKRLRYRKLKVKQDSKAVNGWYPLLLSILRSTIPVLLVQELDCGPRYAIETPPQFCTEDESLIQSAVRESPWTLEDEVEPLMEEIRNGSEDAVASLVIPLLPNLRTIHLARGSWTTSTLRLLTVVTRIAKAARAEIIGNSPPKHPLPLSKLTLVAGVNDGAASIGIELEDLPPFAALPSVKRIIVVQAQDYVYEGWPEDLPQSLVPEVYFVDSYVDRNTMEDFVTQAFGGPCVVRMRWDAGEWHDNDWDHVVVDGVRDPETGFITEASRTQTTDLRYRDSIPLSSKRHSGYSDAWGDMMEGKIWDVDVGS